MNAQSDPPRGPAPPAVGACPGRAGGRGATADRRPEAEWSRRFRLASCLLGILASSGLRAQDRSPEATDAHTGPWFEAAGPETGLVHRDLSGPTVAMGKFFLRDTVGQGIAVLDLDDDGRMDLYFAQGRDGTPEGGDCGNRLYRNLGAGRFEECGEARGAAHRGYGFGALAFDHDGDGDTDLYVTNLGPNALLSNEGGAFKDVTAAQPGLAGADDAWSVGATAGDADGDGDLDLYVANYCAQDLDALQKAGLCRQMSCEVPCGPRGLAAQADRYYVNDGSALGRLVSDDANQSGLLGVTPAYGFQPSFCDLDDDGDLDLYVTNDSLLNFLFLNDGHGRFDEQALAAGVACGRSGQTEAGMGLAIGHLDDDALPELFVTNFSTQANSLYVNETAEVGEPWWQEVGQRAGVGRPSWFQLGWGCQFADLDADGFTDLVHANGHIFPQMDACPPERVTYLQPNSLFAGTGGHGPLRDLSRQAGPGFGPPGPHRASVLVDLDDDGRQDLVFSRLDEPPLLLWNRTRNGHHWLGVLLLREPSAGRHPVLAVGARLRVEAGGRRWTRDLVAGSSFLSTEDPRLHVGLGAIDAVERLVVRLPGGPELVLEAPPIDRMLHLLVTADNALQLLPEPGR